MNDTPRELTRTELHRVCEEFKSERDAAKATAMRAVEERNIAYAEAAALRAEYDALRRQRYYDARANEQAAYERGYAEGRRERSD